LRELNNFLFGTTSGYLSYNMSFTEREIRSKFKALRGIFPNEGIKAEDLHIFFRSSPGLAKICDPESGNAAMANAQGNTVYRFHQALLLGFTALLALLLCAKGHVGRARSTSGEGGAGPRH
jgi:hypothetical protein